MKVVREKGFLDLKDYQNVVMNFVTKEEYKEVLKSMINGDDPAFQQGFIQGLCWASLISVKAKQYFANIEEEVEDNDSDSQAGAGSEDSSSEA